MTAPIAQSAGLTAHAFSSTSLFDQKPLNGGTPAMESQPIRKVTAVTGISFARPPIFLMSCSSSMAWMTEPAPRNSNAL